MGTFGNAVYTMMKRPFILIFVALITSVFCLMDYFIFPVLFGIGAIGTGNIFTSLVNLIQVLIGLFSEPAIAGKVLVYFLLGIVLISLLLGFLLSGYFTVINNSLEGKPKYRGEFFFGVKKYFVKISTMSLRTLLLGVVLLLFLLVAAVPSFVVTNAVISGKTQFLAPAAFIDVLTIGIFFFALMFFRIYAFFWFPSVLNTKEKAFVSGKRVADNFFWNITLKILLFDIVFTVFEIIFVFSDYSIIRQGAQHQSATLLLFAADWVFKTLFSASLVTYIFSAFKMFKGSEK